MFKDFNLIVVGSGLFGSVIAERASRNGYRVAVIEKRSHIAGNCYTEDDAETGINVHRYGPHIFHTSNREIWNYINQFTEFNHYRHRCLSSYQDKLYSMPINLGTINSFYNRNLTPAQAQNWLNLMTEHYRNQEPKNFQEQAMALIGPELYHAFIRGYTKKQWETDPRELPASYARRLPVRTDYNDRYYNDLYEGIPVDGYTPIFERMLNHENIQVFLNMDWFEVQDQVQDQLVVYTGPIDRFYNYQFGRLNWRTIDIDFHVKPVKDFQGVTQVNYPDDTVSFTRIIEHRHFHPERRYPDDRTVIGIEFSRAAQGDDTVYYPVNTPEDRTRYAHYRQLADAEPNTIIGGRLGEYMYYDMHQVIGSALSCYKNKIQVKLQQ